MSDEKIQSPTRSVWINALVIFSLILATYLGLKSASEQQLAGIMASAGLLGPIVFVILKASTDVIAPLNGVAFYLLAVPLFGFWQGLLLVYVGDLFGYALCFVIGRRYGRRFIARIGGYSGVARIDKWFNELGDTRALVYCRTVLFGIQDVVSYAAGLTKISFKKYFFITSFSTLFQTAVGVWAGHRVVRSSTPVFLIYLVSVTVVIPIAWTYLQRRLRTEG